MSLLNRNSILTGSVDSFCLVCESHLRSDDDALLHVAKPIHRKNLDAAIFLDKFKDDRVRKVKKGYYCEHCNVLMSTAAKVGPHVTDPDHGKNKAMRPLKREGFGVLAFNKVFIPENAWHGLIDDTCTVCDAEFDNPEIHKTGNAHVLKLVLINIEFVDENVYRKVDDSTFQCLTCNMVCAQKTMMTHFESQEHRDLYELCCKVDKAKANEPKETSETVKDDKQIKENENSKIEECQEILEKEKPQKPEVEKPKEQPKKELGTVMKQEVNKTNTKVHGANKDKVDKIALDFFKALGAKEFVCRDITGHYWCILCNWSMDEARFVAHMQSKHHLTMLRLHKKRTETKQIESVKEPEENDCEAKNKIKLLGALKEFNKNNVLLNYADGLAYCRVCSKNIDYEYDFIKNHIEEHKKKPAKAAKIENLKPFTIGSNKISPSTTNLLSSATPMNDSESQKEDSIAGPKNNSESKKEKDSSAGPRKDSESQKEDSIAGPKNNSESKKEKDSSAGPRKDSESKKEDSSAGPKDDSKKDSSASPKNDYESKKEKDSSAYPKKDSESKKEHSSAGPKDDSKEDSSASLKDDYESKQEKDSSAGPKDDSESKKEKDSNASPKNYYESKKEKDSSACPKNNSKSNKKAKDSSAGPKNDSECKQEKDSSAGSKQDYESKKEDSSAVHKNDPECKKEKDSSVRSKKDSECKQEKDSSVRSKKDSECKQEKDSSVRSKKDSECIQKKDSSVRSKKDSECKQEKDSSVRSKKDSECKQEKDSSVRSKKDSECKQEKDSSVRSKKDSECKQDKDSSASCSTASKNDFDQEISSPPPKKPKKGKETSHSSSAASAREGDSAIERFSKLHDLNYNSSYNTAFCRVCVSKIPPALKSMKEHVRGTSHKNKVAKVVVPNEAPVEKKPFCEFVTTFSTVENSLVKDVVINEQYCLNLKSFFLLTRHGTKLRCLACEVNLTKTMVEAHKQSPRHERAMDHASVVMSEETEFIREIRPNVFHCGFCNLLESTWRNMQSHLKSTTHRECKIAAYWRVQEYTPLLTQHRGRIRMEYVVFTRTLTEQLNSNE